MHTCVRARKDEEGEERMRRKKKEAPEKTYARQKNSVLREKEKEGKNEGENGERKIFLLPPSPYACTHMHAGEGSECRRERRAIEGERFYARLKRNLSCKREKREMRNCGGEGEIGRERNKKKENDRGRERESDRNRDRKREIESDFHNFNF